MVAVITSDNGTEPTDVANGQYPVQGPSATAEPGNKVTMHCMELSRMDAELTGR